VTKKILKKISDLRAGNGAIKFSSLSLSCFWASQLQLAVLWLMMASKEVPPSLYYAVADPDQAFGGGIEIGGRKKVFIYLNTKGCLRQSLGIAQKWLPFVQWRTQKIFIGGCFIQ